MESEKVIERKLVAEVKAAGGWAIKLLATQVTGLPDRMVLLPEGRMFFVELKSTGKRPSNIQEFVHEKLRGLGFRVYVIDSKEAAEALLK